MLFLYPVALWCFLLLPLLVLLYFVKRPPIRPYWVSTSYLWPQRLEPSSFWSLFAKPLTYWLLLLQALCLTVIIVALAKPVLLSQTSASRTIVFVFDASASMLALEDGQTRFDRARDKALAMLDRLGAYDKGVIIHAAAHPTIISAGSAEKHTLRRAIEELSPTHTVADLTAALLLALSLVKDQVESDIYIFSDGTENAVLPPALHLEQVHYVQIGTRADNVAITRLDVRTHPLSPYDREVYVEVVNMSDRRHVVRVIISSRETLLYEETLALEPGGRQGVVTGLSSHEQRVLLARLTSEDSLDVDNHAYAVIQPRLAIPVLFVSDGHFFLEKVLDVNPLLKQVRIRPEAYQQASVQVDEQVVIFDGFVPQALTRGRYLIINPPDEDARRTAHAPLLRPELTSPHPHHPILRFVDIHSLVVERAFPLKLTPQSTVLLQVGDQPVAMTSARERLRMVTIGLDLRTSHCR